MPTHHHADKNKRDSEKTVDPRQVKGEHHPARQLGGPEGNFSELDKAMLQCVLTEFNALRAEFLSRLNTENLLVLGAIAFLGTIAGVAFKTGGQVSVDIFLLVPVILSLIGIFYINQRLSNTAIGLYIKTDLAERVRILLHLSADVFRWETYVRETTSILKESTIFLPIFLVFVVPNLTVLVGTAHSVHPLTVIGVAWRPLSDIRIDIIKLTAWWAGAALSAAFCVLWVLSFPTWRGQKK
jgi:hypothetical protein